MKKTHVIGTIDLNQLYGSIRRDWGKIKPYTKIEKNKKIYNRKNKTWKNVTEL